LRFEETAIAGAFVVVPERIADGRGFFARTFDREAFSARNLAAEFVQDSIAFNERAGTIRGLHYQLPPDEEVKIVRCTAGALYDVIVDLRRDSATFGSFVAVELSAENHAGLYIPAGCAHGYQTLMDGTEAHYAISHPYTPAAARGIAYDDPVIGIPWPHPVSIISERDRAFPTLENAELP